MIGRKHIPDDCLYQDARGLAKASSVDCLHWWLDSLDVELATAELRWSDILDPLLRSSTIEYDVFAISERRRAVSDEIALRERVGSMSTQARSERDREHQAWRDLAEVVRDRTDLAELFQATGYPLKVAGGDPRRGGTEWCGPCPICGGTDRLRVFTGPPGRAWCRQCRWSADAIAVAQSIVPGCDGFRSAVTFLAETLSVEGKRLA